MRRIYPFVILLFAGSSALSGQARFNNYGANIYVKNGALMTVTNDTANPGSTGSLYNNIINGQGQISNEGTIVVEGYVKNDATILGNGDTIRLTGDWINDLTYTGNNSWVDMYGGNQLITGTAVTTFDNLNLAGGVVKKQQTINSITAGLLQLNDAELATDSFEMLVTNTDTGDITRNNGFVSSLGPGKLSRSTDVSGAYIFPTGSPSYNDPPSIFRPIQMTPAGPGPDVYGACLVKGNATSDGYNTESLDDSLCMVNPYFYHLLYHASGPDAIALTMYYNPGTDGGWTDEAHWNAGRWNYIAPAMAGLGLGFSTVSVEGVSNFTPDPFALAIKKFALTAGPDVQIYEGQSTIFNPVIGTVGSPTISWLPNTNLNCDTCADPTANPGTTTLYTITVSYLGNCKVSDSLTVTVLPAHFVMPTAFTPNGDGKNDFFAPVQYSYVVVKEFHIYDRWGQLVHNSPDPWDGVFNGKQQPPGTYVYYIEVQYPDPNNPSQTDTQKQQGAVTLLR